MSTLPPPPSSRPLGESGFSVSSLAWGMWRFAGRSAAEARDLVEAAFEAGINLFDTADIYGFDGTSGFGEAETLLGQVFAEAPGLRDKMVLASKGGIDPATPYDQSRDYLARAIDMSLRRMSVERIDLYQIHRPDILAHPHEVARALETAATLGKIGVVGVSNFTVAQTEALRRFLPHGLKLTSTQPELSALALTPIEDGTLDYAMVHGEAVLAWSPLGGGRILAPESERERAVAAALDAVAAAQGLSRSAAALSWIIAHPARPIPIIGSQNRARIVESADALKVQWTRKDWYAVLVASRGERLP